MSFFTTFQKRICTGMACTNLNGTIILAGNLLSRIGTFSHNEDSNKETNLSNDHNGHNIINSSNCKSLINDNSAIQLANVKSILKRLCSNHPPQIRSL